MAKYKVLYLEDQNAASIVADFKGEDVELIVDTGADERKTIELMSSGAFDAFLMDYRLTQGPGCFDAPSFAAASRSEGKGKKPIQRPIVLLTNENGLKLVKRYNRDWGEQELFDIIMLKNEYASKKRESIAIIISYIEAYKDIERGRFKSEEVFQLKEKEVEAFIDNRFLKLLYFDRQEKDIFRFLRRIVGDLLSLPGVLIDESYLAARLGVDRSKSGNEWEKLKLALSSCAYCGVLSKSVVRWWMPRIEEWWGGFCDSKSIRRLDARERVEELNKHFGLSLIAASPLKFCDSTYFWVACKATGAPLDPAEGYVWNNYPKKPWEENEYVSALGALEYPSFQASLSDMDKKEVKDYGKKK